ncbi:MAG: TRAP transporter small permease [Syntrophobacterales bacterium]|nr:MAG: TRAP transporter small permease [Syntrophobacterales bacterium]
MERVSDIVNRWTEMAVVIIISAMAVDVFIEVIFRYILLLPLFWTEEFARYCLVWSSLLAAGVALKRGQHIAVTFIVERFPKRIRAMACLGGDILVVAMLAVILWGGIYLVIMTSQQLSPAMRISMSLPYMAIPTGSAIMLFHALTSIYRRSREMFGLTKP